MFCTNCGVVLYEGAAFCAACGQPVGVEPPRAKPLQVAYAGIWLRLVAMVIDTLVLSIPSMGVVIFAMVFLGLEAPPPDAPVMQLPPMRIFLPMEGMFVTVQWLYYASMESSSWQGTLGKRALGIGVSDLNGKRISFSRASVRFFGKVISWVTLLSGYLLAAFTEKQQALHDILSKCIVVRMP